MDNIEEIKIIEDKSGTNGIKRYQKGKFLGKGGFAKCFEFTSLDNNKVYAAKVIQKFSLKRSRHRQKLYSEIRIHKSL